MNKLLISKQLLLLSCISTFSQLSHAGTMGVVTPVFTNGFYVGGGIGAADLMNKESHEVNPETHQLGAVGVLGGGFIGYNYGLTEQWRVALEVFADAAGLNMSIAHSPLSYSMNQRYDVGVRILPEYVFTPDTTGHWILGYVNGKFNIHDQGVYGFVNSGFNQNGFQTGAGFTRLLSNKCFLRLDGLYDLYNTQTTAGIGLTPGTTQSYRNKFSSFAGELSLIYKFS